jgi:hypothetical protein
MLQFPAAQRQGRLKESLRRTVQTPKLTLNLNPKKFLKKLLATESLDFIEI